MGGTTRMSADEKRRVVLSIYHKTKSVYTEKEILTLATKAGVNANTVVEINQSLVDDEEVEKEKIGGSNYFWAFPAKKDRQQQIQHQKVLDEIEQLKASLGDATNRLLDAKRGREDEDADADADAENDTTAKDDTTDFQNVGEIIASNTFADQENQEVKNNKKGGMNRAFKLQRLEEINNEMISLEKEINKAKENDPAIIANYEKELRFVQDAANRWTDNIFNCKSYLVKKRGMNKKEAHKLLGITDAFDYPEDKIPK